MERDTGASANPEQVSGGTGGPPRPTMAAPLQQWPRWFEQVSGASRARARLITTRRFEKYPHLSRFAQLAPAWLLLVFLLELHVENWKRPAWPAWPGMSLHVARNDCTSRWKAAKGVPVHWGKEAQNGTRTPGKATRSGRRPSGRNPGHHSRGRDEGAKRSSE